MEEVDIIAQNNSNVENYDLFFVMINASYYIIFSSHAQLTLSDLYQSWFRVV
jgi:hypothetical protein